MTVSFESSAADFRSHTRDCQTLAAFDNENDVDELRCCARNPFQAPTIGRRYGDG